MDASMLVRKIDSLSCSLWPPFISQYLNPWRALLSAAASSGAEEDNYCSALVDFFPEKFNPGHEELLKKTIALTDDANYSGNLSWHFHSLHRRDILELAPYANDHFGKPPRYMYPEKEITEFSESVLNSGKVLDLAEQLEIALEITKDKNILEAMVICQASYRIAARDKESKVCNYRLGLDERLRITHNTAGFLVNEKNDKKVIDPSGDTYHFWTQALAGYVSEAFADDGKFRQSGFLFLFRQAPILTKYIYKLCGGKTPYGFHEEVDNAGFKFGQALARHQLRKK